MCQHTRATTPNHGMLLSVDHGILPFKFRKSKRKFLSKTIYIPGCTTLQAYTRSIARDYNSFWWQHFLLLHLSTRAFKLNLSHGNQNSNLNVSNSTPRKIIVFTGSIVFSSATGKLISAHVSRAKCTQ